MTCGSVKYVDNRPHSGAIAFTGGSCSGAVQIIECECPAEDTEIVIVGEFAFFDSDEISIEDAATTLGGIVTPPPELPFTPGDPFGIPGSDIPTNGGNPPGQGPPTGAPPFTPGFVPSTGGGGPGDPPIDQKPLDPSEGVVIGGGGGSGTEVVNNN